jgi:hypothetical protein
VVRTADFIIDVLLPFVTNRVLLEGLAISEISEFKAERLVWEVSFKDGMGSEEAARRVSLGGEPRWFERQEGHSLSPISEQLDTSGIPKIGVPGGFVGIQAFYLILENFWRNLVKHNGEQIREVLRQNEHLCVHLDLEDKKGQPYWKASLWADVRQPDDPTPTIRKKLEEGVIEYSMGALRPEAWGTKEMLIAAAHLTSRPSYSLQERPLDILKCELCDGHMVYHFDLLKPQVLHVVTPDLPSRELSQSLATQGVTVSTAEKFPPVVPTEYLVQVRRCGENLERGRTPLKAFCRDGLRLESLQGEAGLLELVTGLEAEFAGKLCPGSRQFQFVIQANPPLDRTLVSVSPDSSDRLCTADFRQARERLDESLARGDFVVLFDRHGDLRHPQRQPVWEMLEKHRDRVFWEPYGGGTHTEFTLQHVPGHPGKRRLLVWQLVTAALLRVAVLDERIQQVLNRPGICWDYGPTAPKIAPLECLEWMRVFVPSRRNGCDLQAPDPDHLKAYVARIRPHLLTMHVGILDKLNCKTPDKVTAWIKEIRHLIGIQDAQVILHSGRGIPVSVPEYTAPFVSYTAVEHWVTSKDLKSKYGLVQELLAARGIRRS